MGGSSSTPASGFVGGDREALTLSLLGDPVECFVPPAPSARSVRPIEPPTSPLTRRDAMMNPRYYHRHAPLLDPSRRRCPVCQHAVYSAAGIHPQCAERQADPVRPKREAKISLRRG